MADANQAIDDASQRWIRLGLPVMQQDREYVRRWVKVDPVVTLTVASQTVSF
jgi:hypothetical protein